MSRRTLKTFPAPLVLVLLPATAPATFHLARIVEVFPGATTAPTAQYIVPQMHFPGQNLVSSDLVNDFDDSTSLR